MSYNKIDGKARIVLLGCGDITRRHTTYARWADKDIQVSFASRTQSKADGYKRKHKGVHAFGSYDAAIGSDDIDIVMVNTPPDSHYELVKASLQAGKHVIVEKPPFFKSAVFDELGPMAENKGLQFLVAENYFYKPLRGAVKEALDEGLIGHPLFIQINATKKQESKGDWRDDKAVTGFGSLFEGGIHWINFINNIGLQITTVNGFVPKQDTELERSVQVTANTEEGTVINLLYSWEVDTMFKGLRLSRIYGKDGSLTFETNGIFVAIRGLKKRFRFPQLSHITGYKLMWKDFLESIHSGTKAEFDWKMAQKDLVLIEQIYASV